MPLTNILEVELFNVQDIDFLGSFPPSYGNRYILVAIDYMFKWVNAEAYPSNDANVVTYLLKTYIHKIWDSKGHNQWRGIPLHEQMLKQLLDKYDMKNKLATTYHPQMNG